MQQRFPLTAIALAATLFSATAAQAVSFVPYDAPSSVLTVTGKIVKGSDGNMFFTRGDTKLSRVTASGQIRTMSFDSIKLIDGATVSVPLTSLVSGRNGMLQFVSEPNRYLSDVNPAPFTHDNPTTFLSFSTFPAGYQLKAMAYGPDQDVWILDPSQNRVLDADFFSHSAYTIPTAGSMPADITVGPDGAMWFTESATNKIGRITPGGAITDYASYAGGKPQAIHRPGWRCVVYGPRQEQHWAY
jgi:hypothetical protein